MRSRIIARWPGPRNRGCARRVCGPSGTGIRRRVADGMIVDHPRYVYTPKVLRGWYGHFLERSVRSCFFKAVKEFRPDVVLGCWA